MRRQGAKERGFFVPTGLFALHFTILVDEAEPIRSPQEKTIVNTLAEWVSNWPFLLACRIDWIILSVHSVIV